MAAARPPPRAGSIVVVAAVVSYWQEAWSLASCAGEAAGFSQMRGATAQPAKNKISPPSDASRIVANSWGRLRRMSRAASPGHELIMPGQGFDALAENPCHAVPVNLVFCPNTKERCARNNRIPHD